TTTGVASTAPTSGLGAADISYQNDVLDRHNLYRRRHHVPDLTWNDDLANYAKEYLDNHNLCFQLEHSGGSYGENLAGGFSTAAAIDAWYNEVSLYDFNKSEFSSATGHFTQVVWKGSTEVGCYTYQCGNVGFWWVVACEYYPRGNIIGWFAENVLPE
ncbi:PR-1-like protein, partial [Nadsonia fulvescens var. elongata DSM 6958]